MGNKPKSYIEKSLYGELCMFQEAGVPGFRWTEPNSATSKRTAGLSDNGTEDAVKWVEKHWRMFFEHMLGDWLTDETLWPQKLSLKLFREWFGVEYQSLVWDLENAPLAVEDWEADDGDEDPTYH